MKNNEVWHALRGVHQGRIWQGVPILREEGGPASVDFTAQRNWLIERFLLRKDIIGFYHTHPTFPAYPSSVDIPTMQAWVFTFGCPLLCLIEGTNGLKGWVFEHDECRGVPLSTVELIESTYIGVDRVVKTAKARRVVSGTVGEVDGFPSPGVGGGSPGLEPR